MVDQALDHRRRGEHGDAGVGLREREDLGGVEATARRDHLLRPAQDVRQPVEPGAVRHRCGVDDAVVRADHVDVGEIAERHREQVAVRDHHALRPSGRAAGVEEPRQVVGRRVGDWRLVVAGMQSPILAAARNDDPLEVGDRAGEIGRDEADARARMVEDVLGLLRMELGVDRHDRESRPPRRPEDLDVLGGVGHQEPDAVSRFQSERRAQRRSHRRAAPAECAVVGQHALAGGDCRPAGEDARRAGEEVREIHYLARKSRIACSALMIRNTPS